ncbi:MAG: hypothetical protein APG10_01831 [Candidatus Methanofastidiosum methylothiophilum]|uniref:Uncharacterized protein n=1 Tax=Candidatus Methanofastidiosum methylothiophilum TaxID=1705564 RepID=A0A150IH68_9EURY|nr:MAG: hypothetical protein APG10_01831 [Candidatus Methanofastidiosum methylthiophilus]
MAFNDSTSANEDTKVNCGAFSGGIFGFRINDTYTPPFGECHSLPLLPLPEVCISDTTTVPSFSSSAICFALLLVESTSSKKSIFFPIILVSSILSSSNSTGLSGDLISLYPSFVLESISYPSSLSFFTCFHTAALEIPISFDISSPDT